MHYDIVVAKYMKALCVIFWYENNMFINPTLLYIALCLLWNTEYVILQQFGNPSWK